MSSLIMFGFFCVSDGCHMPSLKPDSTCNSCYMCYNAAIYASAGGSMQAQIVMKGSFSDGVVTDHTMVFVVGKAYLPAASAREQALLDALYFVPLPGDPSSDAYEFVLPQWTVPFLVGLGRVVSSFARSNSCHSSVSVLCSDFVWDGKMSSKLICSFDNSLLPPYCISSFPRSSLVQFLGLVKDVGTSEGMTIDIKSIVTDVDCTLALRKHKFCTTADSSPMSTTCSSIASIARGTCTHVMHPSLHITHPLCNIGFEIKCTAEEDHSANSPHDEATFFLL
ncbi:hypothetical protein EV401DRAFT_1951436 [Pisolithus croceorrhizus]|nr:hypothetical protein EV401DRAFT_1951436 [Pisolithus croceorrhizus]